MRCSKCGSDNREGRKFCTTCGTPLSAACPKCGAPIQPDERYCGECGASLSATNVALQAPVAETAPDLPVITEQTVPSTTVEGERKTVTALFADLKGSTELLRGLDPEVAQAIVDPALKIMVEAVRYYDGYVVQSTGDGIFALFGAPLAHEDHPQRSVYAALRMQDGLRGYAERLSGESKPAVVARVGVNSGEVVMRAVETGGRFEYTPVGYVTNLASRIQTAAPAGGIAISAETRRLVEGYVELRALGLTELKGVAEPVEVYQVIGLGPLRTHFEVSTRRGLTKFVGRERELAHLHNAMELASSGQGQVVGIVADAGAGKSRLVYEFKALLPSGCKLLEAYSVSYGKASAWLPVLELLRAYFGIETIDDSAKRREKVRTTVEALDPGLNDTLPYLWGLLGILETPDPLAQMDPQIRQRRTRDAIKRIIVSESLVQSLVVIFEDLHWIDAETQALLDLVADSIGNTGVLLLVNYRPEYRHQWANKSYYSQLRLDALGRESASEILEALLGESTEFDALKHIIIERTQGNPFFIEEIVQALFEQGVLLRNRVTKLSQPLTQIRLPATVQGVLASRIDRLAPNEKEFLQTLAVLGREFQPQLVQRMMHKASDELETMLTKLQAAEFIYEQPSPRDTQYTFKHALTQEIAYNSLLIERRQLIHEGAGRALEAMFNDRLDEHCTEIAHHYSRSANPSKAFEYLHLAARQALQRSTNSEAITHFKAALRLLPRLPDSNYFVKQELSLQMQLGVALLITQGWGAPEVEQAYKRALELCRELGQTEQSVAIVFGLWQNAITIGELSRANELAAQISSIAHHGGDTTLLLAAHYAAGFCSYWRGDFPSARYHADGGLSLYDFNRHRSLSFTYGQDLGVSCHIAASFALWPLGFPEQALHRSRKALALARESAHPFSLAVALVSAAVLHLSSRDPDNTRECADEIVALTEQHGISFFLAWGTIFCGWALAKQGAAEAGLKKMNEGMAACRATGAKVGESRWFALQAEIYAELGDIAKAVDLLNEAFVHIEKTDERFYEAEVYRVKGQVALRFRDASEIQEAEDCFCRAIAIARQQQAKSWELRAASSLARLFAQTKRHEEARTTLLETYNWFTEGFDTADLKDAKELLDELSE